MQVFSAKATRDISPPEAIFSSGFNSSPTLGEIRNSTASAPLGDHSAGFTRISTLVFSMASAANSSCTRLANLRAAAVRNWLSFLADFSYAAADAANSFFSAACRSPEVSIANKRVCTSAPNAITSSTVAPYLRFSFSSAAMRVSISSNRAGSASNLPM